MRKLFLMLLGLAIAVVANAQSVEPEPRQSIEPLQEKYDNKFPADTYIDTSLIEGDVIVSNSKGDKLMSYKLLANTTYYVAIKLADGNLYYGLVWSPKNSNISDIDVLNGFKVEGQMVHSDGKVERVQLYRERAEITNDAKRFAGRKFTTSSHLNDAVYSLVSNGTGKVTWTMYRGGMAPQAVASSWREGGRTRHGYTGGYYFDLEATYSQSITWKVKGDKITIKYGGNVGAPSIKATVDEIPPESDDHWEVEGKRLLNAQFRADISTNEDVKKAKNKLREEVKNVLREGEYTYRFAYIDGVGMVLFPQSGDSFNYGSGLIWKGINPNKENYRYDIFDMDDICAYGNAEYAHYRENQVTTHQQTYAAFAMNIQDVLSYIYDNRGNYLVLCDHESSVYDIMGEGVVCLDPEFDSRVLELDGITAYSITDVNPYENVADMVFVRARNDMNQVCSTKINFTDDGVVILDSFKKENIKILFDSHLTLAKIQENHEYLMQKQNKKLKMYKQYYKEYEKRFKSVKLDIRFTTFRKANMVRDDLKSALDLQKEYLTRLENSK